MREAAGNPNALATPRLFYARLTFGQPPSSLLYYFAYHNEDQCVGSSVNTIFLATRIQTMDPSFQTFHPFARLPRELRLEIWMHAILVPRNVLLQVNQGLATGKEIFFTPIPNPSILHVNHEARAEGLSVYNPGFGSDIELRKIYINLEMDTIETDIRCWGWLTLKERRSLRKLRLNIAHEDNFVSEGVLFDGTMEMSGLREFDIVSLDPGYPDHNYAYNYGDLRALRSLFEQRFQHVVGWKCPTLRLVEDGSTLELEAGSMEPVHIWHKALCGFSMFDEE